MRRSRSSAAALAACAGCAGVPVAKQPACSAESQIVLAGDDDVALAAGCLTIESLTIRTGAELDLSPLRRLHVILGTLRVGPSVGLDSVQLPALHSVGALEIIGNGNLHGVMFPKLVTAGTITIADNVALTTISMPALSRARGDVTISGGGELGIVEASSLAVIEGDLRIADNPKLTLVELGKLERAHAVTIDNNRVLAPELAEALRAKAAP